MLVKHSLITELVMFFLNHCPYTYFTVTLILLLSPSGVRRWKDLLCEDPCTVGSAGHLCWRTEDQSPIQGKRHPRQQWDAHELALHPLSSAGAHHAPWAGLFHSSFQQEQGRLLPYRQQRHVLPSFRSQQNSKDADPDFIFICDHITNVARNTVVCSGTENPEI